MLQPDNIGAPSRERCPWVVIVNWNGFHDTLACLNSMTAVTEPQHKLLVVDNGSTDDSPTRLATAFPNVEIIRLEANRGLAAGYNAGIAHALAGGAAYIVVMNNDVIVAPSFLSELCLSIERNGPKAGIVMPKIYLHDDPKKFWSAGAFTRWFPGNHIMIGAGKTDRGQFDHLGLLDFVPTCCVMITRSLAATIQFDEDYFFYFDDWDYCKRARKLGYEIYLAPAAHIWHKVSQSTMNSVKSLKWWGILGESSARYHRKFCAASLVPYVCWVVFRELVKLNPRGALAYVKGVQRIAYKRATV